jgi:tetratricopeptide (TPR) repeat protein
MSGATLRALARGGITVLLAASSFAGSLDAQDEIFQRGNQLYQAEDYPAAIEAYEAVLAAGFESHDLHYNLGNAYFKTGDLGRSILAWERSLKLEPGDADAIANLQLASGLTVDDIEPLPRFWLLSVVSWWVNLVPRSVLILIVGAGWLALTAGFMTRILAHTRSRRRLAQSMWISGAAVVLLFGTNLMVRELGIGSAERGVIVVEAIHVRSAPADDDNLTLFEVHEGTRVRIDQRTERWAEIVLDDGKVGWIPVDVVGII